MPRRMEPSVSRMLQILFFLTALLAHAKSEALAQNSTSKGQTASSKSDPSVVYRGSTQGQQNPQSNRESDSAGEKAGPTVVHQGSTQGQQSRTESGSAGNKAASSVPLCRGQRVPEDRVPENRVPENRVSDVQQKSDMNQNATAGPSGKSEISAVDQKSTGTQRVAAGKAESTNVVHQKATTGPSEKGAISQKATAGASEKGGISQKATAGASEKGAISQEATTGPQVNRMVSGVELSPTGKSGRGLEHFKLMREGQVHGRELLKRLKSRRAVAHPQSLEHYDASWQPPSLEQVLGVEGAAMGASQVLKAPVLANSPNTKFPNPYFNGKYQNFKTAFDFAWWCNNTWSCTQNPSGSVTLNSYWNNQVSGFGSRQNFFYGVFSVEMRLPYGNSDGMYHTFYLIQPQNWPNNDSRHAEIDIEFYGAKDPKSIVIATNIITNGYERLEQHALPFDPSAAYHRYSIAWGPQQIVFFVDNHPIRIVHRPKASMWPARPVQLIGTTWAIRNDVDWSAGPMSVNYNNIQYQTCASFGTDPPYPPCHGTVGDPKKPWNLKLSARQVKDLKKYRDKYLLNAWDWGKWNGYAKLLFSRKH